MIYYFNQSENLKTLLLTPQCVIIEIILIHNLYLNILVYLSVFTWKNVYLIILILLEEDNFFFFKHCYRNETKRKNSSLYIILVWLSERLIVSVSSSVWMCWIYI